MRELPPPAVEKRHHDVEVDHDSVAWDLNPSREQLHRMRAYYYANMEMIDREVGEILDALEEAGRLDNAIIIFTSDHGDLLGDHGLSQKWIPYEEVTRVPLIISAPKRFKPGRKIDKLVQLFDLGPTILEWAGVTPPESMEAMSLNPALEGEAFEGRRYALLRAGGRREPDRRGISDDGALRDAQADPLQGRSVRPALRPRRRPEGEA